MKYLLSGGGTGGPVTPLLSLAEELKQRDPQARFLLVGSGEQDPSLPLAEHHNIAYRAITAGKLRRALTPANLLAPWKNFRGFWQARTILNEFRPDVVISAGSYASVPLAWAAFWSGIPILIHQQDVRPSLSNLLMAPIAKRITVTFVKSIKRFPRKKTIYTGNPVRASILTGDKKKAIDIFSLKKNKPTVLILGGGTGALTINQIISESLPKLLRVCQIIHVAGKGKNLFQDQSLRDVHRPKSIEQIQQNRIDSPLLRDYHVYEFLTDELPHALAAADVVISRAGLATLTELCALAKPSIIIPLHGSHQEENVKPFEKENAAVILSPKNLTPEIITNEIKLLLEDEKRRTEYQKNMKKVIKNDQAAAKIVNEIMSLIRSKKHG